MEVAPTCHYVMGGVRVDADRATATVPGLFAAGEVAGGMHGANRLGGNSLSDLLVFGRRAGQFAAEHARSLTGHPGVDQHAVDAAVASATAPFEAEGGENPYQIQHDLQNVMQSLVGIIRTEAELEKAEEELATLRERAARVRVEGSLQYNPGWHQVLDLRSLLTVSECVTKSALARKESRGGHTRDDYPLTDPELGKLNMVARLRNGALTVTPEPIAPMPDELSQLLEESH